jgi:hypothetical protein
MRERGETQACERERRDAGMREREERGRQHEAHMRATPLSCLSHMRATPLSCLFPRTQVNSQVNESKLK